MKIEWLATISMSGRRKADCLRAFESHYRGLMVRMVQDGHGDKLFALLAPRNSAKAIFQCGTESELLAFIDQFPRHKFEPTFAEVLRLRALCQENGIDPDGAEQDILCDELIELESNRTEPE